MRHNRVAKKFGRKPAHRKALMRNMVTNLVLRDSIRTTLPKAKEARKDAERLVTIVKKGLAKDGNPLAARRAVSAFLQNAKMSKKWRKPSLQAETRKIRRELDPVKRLFDVVVPRLNDRTCGYTRIIKLNRRRGDAAEVCLLQWVTVAEPLKKEEAAPADGAAAAAAEPAKAETPAEEPAK